MLTLLLGAWVFFACRRYAGEAGRERFMRLSDRRARGVHDYFVSRATDWILVGAMVVTVADAVGAAYLRAWVYLVIAAAGLVVMQAARRMLPRVADNLDMALAQRGLEPLTKREDSARRDRRQKQFGLTAVGAYGLGRVLRVLHHETEHPAFAALMGLTTIVMIVGFFALLWSMAWRFGDEQPTRSRAAAPES